MNEKSATFRPGDLVEVKTAEEILATLDADGTLDHLPFMPEMVEYCGHRFQVGRPVARMCMTGEQVYGTMREFTADDIVMLDDVRCSGAAHDGCQRACAIFWRAAWLRKVDVASPRPPVTADAIERLRQRLKVRTGPQTYFCQASEFFKLTSTLTRRDQVERCVHEVRTGHCGALEMIVRVGTWLFWKIRRKLLGEYARGRHTSTTPTMALNLKPGEWVEVKPLTAIVRTLNTTGYNRGLYFSPDMRLACGRRYRVSGRLDRIIEDGTGKMRHLRNTVALEGSRCACPYVNIGGCTRADLVYWREIWLRRVAAPAIERDTHRRGGDDHADSDRHEVVTSFPR